MDGTLPEPSPFLGIPVGDVGRTDTGMAFAGVYPIYEYHAVTPAFRLQAGSYAVAIVANTTDDPNDDWMWSGRGGQSFYQSSPGGAWVTVDMDHAFYLTDDVIVDGPIPEPASFALVALGGIGLLRRRRRRS
jgi:hypothetical protein